MVLKEITSIKREELSKKPYLNSFKSELTKSDRDFKKAISGPKLNLIAEIKKASPSKGLIRKDFDLTKIVKEYNIKEVSAISVLTDEQFFQGKLEYLQKVRKLTKKPLLRKDFIIDEYQVYESRYYGADAILLIAAILTKDQINRFIDIAKSYNMQCLVEVHTSDELKKVLETKADIIGINNRNLRSLKTDINTTLRLVNKIPKKKVIVSESGFFSKEDIEVVKNNVNAVLIGTSLMKEAQIKKKIIKLMKPHLKICGITNQKDALASKDAEIIGFNFFPESSRYITKESAKKIIAKLPKTTLKAGVFVNEDPKIIVGITKYCKLDIIQLHGDESNNFIKTLKSKIKKPIIKAIRVKTSKDIEMSDNYPEVDYLLFDTKINCAYGGTGKSFNWKLLKNISKPFFLSGGLNTQNINKAISEIDPYGLDLCSSIESKPGKKDTKKLKKIIENVKDE